MTPQKIALVVSFACLSWTALADVIPMYGISINDRATAASCTGSSCCIPSCEFIISATQGCDGSQSVATACDEVLFGTDNNCKAPFAVDMCGGYLDITAACDGRLPGLQLRGAGSTGFDDLVEYQWTVGSCQQATEGGTQCAPDTGCEASEGHVGPQGTPEKRRAYPVARNLLSSK